MKHYTKNNNAKRRLKM